MNVRKEYLTPVPPPPAAKIVIELNAEEARSLSRIVANTHSSTRPGPVNELSDELYRQLLAQAGGVGVYTESPFESSPKFKAGA